VKKVKFGETTKLLLIEDEKLFEQGDDGDKAYMIVAGRLAVFVDNIKVGSMSDGEVFGELALLLNQKRSATIISITPTELIEIDKNGLEKIIESASDNTKKMIYQLCEALSKREEFQKVPFSESDLMSNLDPENELITKFAKQIFHRLDHSTAHVE
jgi:CRP-like cAMP-binding protein|tara:strand:- start:175 stop:642 length:468 start_codon:yes stop_codon:yes gene_type:complete